MPPRRSKPRADTRRSDGGFSPAEAAAFMAGQWVACRSSNVAAARWIANDEALQLRFNDGSVYEYAPVFSGMAESFADAPSKGHWRWVHFPGRGHRRIN